MPALAHTTAPQPIPSPEASPLPTPAAADRAFVQGANQVAVDHARLEAAFAADSLADGDVVRFAPLVRVAIMGGVSVALWGAIGWGVSALIRL